jgi:hypothetical protein
MTERQKTIGALAVLSAAIGVYAEINYQAKQRNEGATKPATSASTRTTPPPPSSSSTAPMK